jgi:glyoxylase-like metal-dependent hydrolase (beta-lactamase superfamily II)
MRAVSVHPDALVLTSRMWQTTATALRAGDEALLIDSPFFPDELEILPGLVRQAGFDVRGLLATHADFDHLLGRLAFPELPLGVGEPTMLRLRAEPGAAQRALRDQDEELYVERSGPLGLGQVQSLPVPGRLELGPAELELHAAGGHTADGTAIFDPRAEVLVCGDYLSDVEIPTLGEGGSLDSYRATLAGLAPLLDRANVAIPGHGSPLERENALRILDEDLAYLDALERGEERPALPAGRDGGRQRQLHAGNLATLA